MVEDEIVFSLNSEPVAANPQFTLTCISTGGPATTVTWTRGSEAVPGETMPVLNNATTAQYTHTLNVTGRLGGDYQCNVSNNIPSEDNASITLEGELRLFLKSKSCLSFEVLHTPQLPQLPMT